MKTRDILLIVLLLSFIGGCRFSRKASREEISGLGLVRVHQDSIIIFLADSFSGITKFSIKESGDTLYIYDIYSGNYVANRPIYISPSIKYVDLQGYTQEIDSIKKPRE